MKNKPESVALDPHFFALLDKKAESAEKVVLCRKGGQVFEGERGDVYTLGRGDELVNA